MPKTDPYVLREIDYTHLDPDSKEYYDLLENNLSISQDGEEKTLIYPTDTEKIAKLVKKCIAYTQCVSGRLRLLNAGCLMPQIEIEAKELVFYPSQTDFLRELTKSAEFWEIAPIQNGLLRLSVFFEQETDGGLEAFEESIIRSIDFQEKMRDDTI